jgi:hypothetical protein
MPSTEVLSALQSLQQELEKLQPAVRHIEAAESVIATAGQIAGKHSELLDRIHTSDARHKEELKALFAIELSALAAENRSLQELTLGIQQAAETEQAAAKVLQERITDYYARLEKINFPERLDNLRLQLENLQLTVKSLELSLSHSVTSIQQSIASVQASIERTGQKERTLHLVTWILLAFTLATTITFRYFLK